jgi:predicted transcriptional regulator
MGQDRILELLRENEGDFHTVEYIAKKLDICANCVRRALGSLEFQGLVEKKRLKQYGAKRCYIWKARNL